MHKLSHKQHLVVKQYLILKRYYHHQKVQEYRSFRQFHTLFCNLNHLANRSVYYLMILHQ